MHSGLFRGLLILFVGLSDSQDIQYTITAVPPLESNLVQVFPSTSYLELVAGVPYTSSVVTASGPFFTSSIAQVNAKLVFSNETNCSASTVSLLGVPFDGVAKPTQMNQLYTRWGTSIFDSAGDFTLCYAVGPMFKALSLDIHVKGVVGTTHKIFCMFTNRLSCKAKLPGLDMPGVSRASLGLVAFSTGNCGSSVLTSPFSRTISFPSVTTTAYEIHDMGLITESATVTSYKACYCPSYQAKVTSPEVCTELTGNFVQTIGALILVSVSVVNPQDGTPSVIFPRSKVNIFVTCGTGGCSTTFSPRIRIVETNSANFVPYYDESAGCRAALQSSRYVGPSNCDPTFATSCNLVRSDSPADSRKVTFNNIQLDSELLNGIRIARTFDICFCDSGCTFSNNWFMAGSVQVQRLTVQFSVAGSAVQRPRVNMKGSIDISGSTAGSFRTSGTMAREMKILSDPLGAIGSTECASYEQLSSLVSGHDCYSVSNCAVPVISSTTSQTFGDDGISILQSGWIAVCYCNAECTSSSNWIVAGRLMISGPASSQQWTAVSYLPFALAVRGAGFTDHDFLSIVPRSSTCGTAGAVQATTTVKGPLVAGTTIGGSNIAKIEQAITSSFGGSGTVVYFGQMAGQTYLPDSHGLSDGDTVELSGVQSVGARDATVDLMFNSFHVVSVIDVSTVIIPVDFPPGSFPTSFTLTASAWRRSNLAVFDNIMALQPGQYSVCWTPINNPTGPTDFAAKAGTLTVTAPTTYTGALGLATVKPQVAAPVVLQFTTSHSSRFTDSSQEAGMRLKIIFGSLSLLTPLDSHGSTLVINSLPSSSSGASLDVCGFFFKQFGAANSAFPLPSGCYFRNDPTSGSSRYELVMVFNELNFLATAEKYSVVMFAESAVGLSPVNPVRGPVEIWLMGPSESDVIEIFLLKPNRAVVTPTGTALDVAFTVLSSGAGPLELQGFCSDTGPDDAHKCINCSQESDCGNSDLSRTWCVSPVTAACAGSNPSNFKSFEFSIDVNSGEISPSSQVRLMLFPALSWNIQLLAIVTCTSNTVGKSCGSGLISAVVENIVPGDTNWGNANVIRLLLPADMDAITPGISYRYSVASLKLPAHGFFPNVFYCEIVGPDGTSNLALVPSASSLFVLPRVADASLVISDGNTKPFKGDLNNVLYLKTVLGFDIAGAGSAITIQMPPGYVCKEETVLNCITDPACMHDGVTPKSLSVFSNQVPSGRGLVGIRTQTAEDKVAAWTKGAGLPACILTLKTTTIFPGDSSLYFALNVNNPSSALQATTTSNKWTLRVSSSGVTSVPFTVTSNVAVLGKLDRVTIAPTKFGLGQTNELFIFLKTENRCSNGTNAVVAVEAPRGFDFEELCLVYQLEADYQVSETADGVLTNPLPFSGTCTGSSTTEQSTVYNKATLITSASLEGSTMYGFRLRVKNPTVAPTDPRWRITTLSSSGHPCDSTYASTSVKLNPDDPIGTSWEVSQSDLALPTVTIKDMRPTDTPSTITIFPIRVTTPENFDIRIIAPSGYVWDFTPGDLKLKSLMDGGTAADSVSGATASLPVGALPTAPLAAPLNVLTIDYLESALVIGKLYGIEAKIRVPRVSPTGSSNQFYVQIGRNAEAAAVPAAPVRSLTRGYITYSTNIVSRTDNRVCFQFKTVTSIPAGGSLVVTAPAGFTFRSRCVPRPWNLDLDSMLPNDVTCYTTVGVGNVNSVYILAGKSTVPNRTYRFCTDATNPSTPTVGAAPTWEFKSFAIASVTSVYLDFPSVVSGFFVASQMSGGWISGQQKVTACKSLSASGCSAFEQSYWRAGRDDRPGHANNLLFELTPLVAGPTPSILTVRAPEGFVFAHECVIVVDKARVLGEGVTVPVTYANWPAYVVLSCTGTANVATIALSSPLTTGLQYLFRISVLANPTLTPLTNKWALEYNREATIPSSGFAVWTFSETSAVSTNQAAGESNVLVEISFVPLNPVPSSGFLVIIAPSGFIVPTACTATVSGGVTALCAGTPTASNRFTVTIAGGTPLQSGSSYTVSVLVTNPQVVLDARSWLMTSYESSLESGILDSSSIEGFLVVAKLTDFQIRSFSSVAGSDPVTLTFSFQLSSSIFVDDSLTLTAPLGFVLNGKGRKSCTGYTVSVNSSGIVPLQRTTPVCVGNSLTWTFALGAALLEANEEVVVSISTVNPKTTPPRNFFVMRHYRNSVLLETWSNSAPSLIPQLVNPAVAFSASVMAGAGSTSTIMVSFRTVSQATMVAIQGWNTLTNEPFLLKNSVLVSGSGNARITGRPEQMLVLAGSFAANSDITILLRNVVNPQNSGASTWMISTYRDSTNAIKDQARAVVGPTVLGKLTIGESSTVSPRTYGSLGSIMALVITSSVELPADVTLVLAPASGYALINNTYQSVFGLNAGSAHANTNGQYAIVLAEPVRASAEFSFAIKVELPAGVQTSRNWRITAVDSTGATIATNDGLFAGFPLISLLPFNVYPENSTPSALIQVHISYTVPTAVVGVNTVTMQITAPTGFAFASSTSCLARSSVQVWQACIAASNVATLVSGSPTIAAGAGSVDVILTNPSVTPDVNIWQIVMYTDGDTSKFTNVDTSTGYAIKAMPVTYVGGNRLGSTYPGFFSFQLSAAINTYFQVVIKPAVGAGYTLSCTPGYQVGMRSNPLCSDTPGETGAPITLTVPSEALNPSLVFTVGVSVKNPALSAFDNYFTLTVLNPLGTIIDANVRVPSTDLRSVLMSAPRFTYDTSVARSLTNVVFSLKIDSPLTSGSDLIRIYIKAPDNFIVSSSSSVKVSSALPLSNIKPVAVAGNTVTVTLDSSKPIDIGTYTVGFPVMNPGEVPINNVWVMTIYSGNLVLLTSPMEGYQFT